MNLFYTLEDFIKPKLLIKYTNNYIYKYKEYQ